MQGNMVCALPTKLSRVDLMPRRRVMQVIVNQSLQLVLTLERLASLLATW